VSRERINVSLTEEGLSILDHERQSMGLSRSAMFEVLLRFWIRDRPAVSQGRAATDVGDSEEPPRRSPKKKSR
jgi:hypothetical protein